MENLVSKSLRFYGRVQGVGFRYFFSNLARQYKITGWVKNEPDGTVSAEITGVPENVEFLIEKAKEGPDFGCVRKVDIIDLPNIMKFEKFTIRY